jgi:hypothetical protein
MPIKHWKAYIKYTDGIGVLKQYVATVAAENQFEAINKFKLKYGSECLIGWIEETKLYGLQSAGY